NEPDRDRRELVRAPQEHMRGIVHVARDLKRFHCIASLKARIMISAVTRRCAINAKNRNLPTAPSSMPQIRFGACADMKATASAMVLKANGKNSGGNGSGAKSARSSVT